MLKRHILSLAAAAGIALAAVPATTSTAEAGHKWHKHKWHGHKWKGHHRWGGPRVVIGGGWGYPYYYGPRFYGPRCYYKAKYRHHGVKVKVCY